MIVDHNADEVHFFSEAVRCLDFNVQCIAAYNGQQALEILRSGVVPDYIFLDLTIEAVSSRKALKAIRKERSYKNIPVVIFGTSIQEEEKDSFRKAGADHFLVRPPGLEDLCNSLKSIITNGR